MVEAKLRAGGAVLLGKLATHEFAIGGPSFDLPFPPARNPWNLDHFTGGSSSGSGAAVAAGIVRMAMGSDTGGSIRGPAFYCGIVGLKPTYGRVSRRGVFPLSYTLDHCGPLTWTVEDAALTMQVIAGHDPLDPASADVPVADFAQELGQDLDRAEARLPALVLCRIRRRITDEVIASLDAAAQQLAQLGADGRRDHAAGLRALQRLRPRHPDGRGLRDPRAGSADAPARLWPLHLPAHDGRRDPVGGRSGAGAAAAARADDAGERRGARHARRDHHRQWLDARRRASTRSPPTCRRRSTLQTMPFNVTGNPVLAIPTGFSKSGLPLGMQIVGRAFDEATVLRIGAAYEAAAGWIDKRPELELPIAV